MSDVEHRPDTMKNHRLDETEGPAQTAEAPAEDASHIDPGRVKRLDLGFISLMVMLFAAVVVIHGLTPGFSFNNAAKYSLAGIAECLGTL